MLAQAAHAAADKNPFGTGPALVGLVAFGVVVVFIILRLVGAPWRVCTLMGVAGGSACGFTASMGKHPLPVQAGVFAVVGLAAFVATIWLIIKKGD